MKNIKIGNKIKLSLFVGNNVGFKNERKSINIQIPVTRNQKINFENITFAIV